MSSVPTVAVVGRPNVGKSTLVNRILGRREAIVEERPGVTRDRKSMAADWRGRDFLLIDTGGWISGGEESLDGKVTRQSQQAIDEADVVLFVVDATVGVTVDDEAVAHHLRHRTGPTFLVANKVDGPHQEAAIWELLALGVGDPHPVSALHGRGTGDLLDELIEVLPAADGERPTEDRADSTVAVAIVGRPNVGKSTLFNRLVGEDRSVVHDLPGTTRDSVDTVVETPYGPLRFVDTAGMRRRSRVGSGTEYYSVIRALDSVDRADIALLVIDATEGVTHQDQRLAERIDAAGCPTVIVLNKWELLDAEARADLEHQLGRKLRFMERSPVLKISALTGKGVARIHPILDDAIATYHRRVPTREVNRVIRAAQSAHPAPDGARVLYATQGATDPPTFTLFTNRTLPRTYLRYLERRLREEFALGATPLKLRVRRRT